MLNNGLNNLQDVPKSKKLSRVYDHIGDTTQDSSTEYIL